MKTIDFNNYKFRSSQSHFLMTGTIGLTDLQKEEMSNYIARKKANENGEKDEKGKLVAPLTANMEEKLKGLIEANEKQELPKTLVTELRKIHRAETFNRNFSFINKYIVKGVIQENEAITTYQNYRKQVLGLNTFFTKNTERLTDDYFTGEWDLPTLADVKKMNEGFDIKTSWDLSTFPFKEDALIDNYYWQNMVYMILTGAEKWTTVYVLVNGTEHLVNNEKNKILYSLNVPNEETEPELYAELIKKYRDIEKMMIFDYDRFVSVNPYHNMEISREEWYGEGFDIPLEFRVMEKTVLRDENAINDLKHRARIARNYLNNLK